MKKRFKVIFTILLVCIMSMVLISCKSNSSNDQKKDTSITGDSKYPLTIKDSNGNEVKFDSEPKKIISLAPSVTEMVYALGKGDELVGRTTYCDYPEQVKDVNDIGTITKPDLETIAQLKPDVVVAATHFDDDTKKKLEELNIKVVVLYSENSFESVYDSIQKLGNLINANDNATEIITKMKNKVSEVNQKVRNLEKTSMYYVVSFGKGDYTAGGDTFIGKIIKLAGGKNIADDTKGWVYSKEALVKNNPSTVVISIGKKNEFMNTDVYKDLDAVKNNKVIEMDTNKLDRQGPRLAEGLEDLAKILHPEVFK